MFLYYLAQAVASPQMPLHPATLPDNFTTVGAGEAAAHPMLLPLVLSDEGFLTKSLVHLRGG